jgi:hypothetical protein
MQDWKKTSHSKGGEKVRYTKGTLPEKICAACGRPFAWRKKWARCWEEVRYCSKACQGRKAPRPLP